MTDQDAESLGAMVRRLREAKQMSQEKLGEEAGYESGAGISILRIEKQGVIPRQARLDRIAEALGVEASILQAAAERSRANGSSSERDELAARVRKIRDEESRYAELDTHLLNLEEASRRARTDFLLPLRAAAGLILDAPNRLDADVDDHVASEAGYLIQFARAGVAQALADASTASASYEELLGEIKTGATAAAVGSIVGSSVALAGLTSIARLLPFGGGVLALPAALAVSGIVATATAAKSSRQRTELEAAVKSAEDTIDSKSRNVAAIEEIAPRASRILDEIATFGTRALHRWGSKLAGSSRITWTDLGPVLQDNYLALLEVAGAQIAVSTISIQDLFTLRELNLSSAVSTAIQVLDQAEEIVAARV